MLFPHSKMDINRTVIVNFFSTQSCKLESETKEVSQTEMKTEK